MTIIVTNQKPATLDPVHRIACAGAYDPFAAIQTALIDPLLVPLNPGGTTSIVDTKGNDVQSGIAPALEACLQETVDPAAESFIKDLLGQTLVSFKSNTSLLVNELFAAQAGAARKMLDPSPSVIYTARDDVIPAAKALLASGGADDDAQSFFASLAFAFHPNTLGFWFQSEAAFDDFKAWAAVQTQTLSSVLPGNTAKVLHDFQSTKLNGLTESLLLRADDADGNDEFSFPRVLVNLLMGYIEHQRAQSGGSATAIGALPFTVGELFCPRSVVLVNVEKHARARPTKVSNEWKIINQSLASPIKVISHQSLSQLTSFQRAAAKANVAAAQQQKDDKISKSASVKFRQKAPTSVDLFVSILAVLKRMGTVNRSQNIFKTSRTSFQVANRRNPDDPNKPGRIVSTSYMPDLHLYIDTSGSISEANYQDVVIMMIKLAKRLNVNIYFNTFSHVLSQETLLRVENRSVTQIWENFRRIPKVDGWTDYKQIWEYVNASSERKRRLSLVITDFEWTAPTTREEHPKNLYYAPCSAMNWKRILRYANNFVQSMRHIDPAVPQHMLGLYK